MYHTGRQLITLHVRQDVRAKACGKLDLLAVPCTTRLWLAAWASLARKAVQGLQMFARKVASGSRHWNSSTECWERPHRATLSLTLPPTVLARKDGCVGDLFAL
jgi:hypothetical protein